MIKIKLNDEFTLVLFKISHLAYIKCNHCDKSCDHMPSQDDINKAKFISQGYRIIDFSPSGWLQSFR